MGYQSAANDIAQGTNQSMLWQTGATQQQLAALQAAQASAAKALKAGQTQGVGALQQGQTGALGALGDYYNQGIGFQNPYLQAGSGAINQLAAMLQGQGLSQGPTLDQLQMDPGYAFRLQQGQKALNQSIAAGLGGATRGGGAIKAALEYGQGMGSQEYGNAYNRFMQQRQMQLGALQNLGGMGLQAAGTATGLAGQTGANIGNVYTGTGQNLANLYGQTGRDLANVYTGTGNQLANVWGNYGQGMGQGAANIGSAYANAAMGPTNLLAALAGQGMQGLGMWAGGGFKKPW